MTLTRKRGLAVSAALLALAIAALALGLFPQEPVRLWLERRLRAAAGPTARIGGLHVFPARLRVEIRDLALEGPSYHLDVPSARATLSARILFGGGASLRAVEAESPRLLLRAGTGTVAAGAPALLPLIVERFDVRRASLVYRDPDLGGDLSLEGLELHGSLGEGRLDVRAGGGTWDRPRPLKLGPALARLRVSPLLDVQIESLEAGTDASRVRVSGSLGRVFSPKPDLRLEGRLALADLTGLDGAPAMVGDLDLRGRLSGAGETLASEVRIAGRELRVAGWPIDRADARLEHSGAGGGRTKLSAAVDLLGGRLEAEARLRRTLAAGRIRLSALDLDRLRHAAALGRKPLAGSLSGDLGFEGDLAHDLTLKASLTAAHTEPGLGAHVQADASGTFRVADRSLDLIWTANADGGADHTPVRSLRVRLNGTLRGPFPPAVEASLEGTLALAGHAGNVDASLRGTARARGRDVELELDARALGGSVIASAETHRGVVKRLTLRGEALRLDPLAAGLVGDASFGLEASGPAGGLALSGQAGVVGLAWRGATIGPVTARFEGRQDLLAWTLDLPALTLTGSGQVRSSPGPALTGTLTLARTPLGALSPLMPRTAPLEGAVSAAVDLRVPIERPAAAELTARVSGLELSSGRFAARAASPFAVSYRGGRFALEGLRLEGSGVAVEASGSFGLDPSARLECRLRADVDLPRVPPPPGWTLAGHASGEATLGGSVVRPEARGRLAAQDVSLVGPALPPLSLPELHVDLAGDTALLSPATASVAGGSVTVSASVPLAALVRAPARESSRPEAWIRASWTGLEAGRLLEHLRPGGAAPLEGSLSGEVHVEGKGMSPRELSGGLTIPATSLQVQDLPVEVAPATVRLEGGRIETDGITLAAEGGSFQVAGSLDLVRRTIQASGKGPLELRALSPFMTEASVTGTAAVDLLVQGSLGSPHPRGTLAVRDGTLRLRAIPQALTGINGTLAFDESSVRLHEMTAVLGGGTVALSGTGHLERTILSDVRLEISGRDMALRYPEGLRSRATADLVLTGRSGAFRLAGAVRAQRGLYALDIVLEESLLASASRKAESRLLRAIALDVTVETEEPVRVRNNVAELEAGGRLVIRGDMETPTPVGHLDIVPGGKIFLQGREFGIDRGGLTYNGTWSPDLALEANARLSDIREANGNKSGVITVHVEADGPLEKPRLHFRSDPFYSEPKIVTMIATGRIDGEALASGKWIAGEQAAALLAGRLSRSLSQGLRSVGIDEASIQPELVARETDPGARFTFGKRLSGGMRIVYSLSLQDPEARFLMLELAPGRDVALSVRRMDDGTFAYGAGQRFRLGGAARPRAPEEERVRLAEVRFEEDHPFEPEALRRMVHAEPGRKALVWDLQDDADRLRQRLIEKGYIEAEVGARLEGDAAVFRIRSGARYRWRVEGMKDPPDLGHEILHSLFEEEALERGRERLFAEARRRGHLRAAVSARGVPEGEGRTLLFTVEPGPVVEIASIRFPGASALSESRLLKAAGGPGRVLSEPEEAVKDLLAAYRAKNYLAAEVDPPRVGDEGGRVRVVVPVREGMPARVMAIRFEGARRPAEELAAVGGLATGEAYSEARVAAGLERIRDHYFTLGYPSIRLSPSLVASGTDLALVIGVDEGGRRTVGPIAFSGLSRTRETLARRWIGLHPGDPLDPRKLAQAERRLLDVGVFSRAAIHVADGDPAALDVAVEEDARLLTGYDFRWSDADKGQAQVDLELRNLLGTGLAAGARYRLGRDVREGRGSIHLPSLGRLGDLTISVFRIEEDFSAIDPFTGASTESTRVQKGLQLQQQARLPNRWNLLYGYRIKRVVLLPLFPEPTDVAALDFSLLRETRDSILDARRGRFLSLNVEYSPAYLGSDFTFVKSLAQVFVNRSFRSSWTWAQGYRLGLAHGFGGQRLVSGERFKAGGGNTLRGFASDSLGPRDFLGDPTGGQAVVVLNQELRYRHRSGLGATVFYDLGNVFPSIREMSFDLRHALGAGLRWDSPVGLLRLDAGIPLDHQEGEQAYRFFFSLGQAF